MTGRDRDGTDLPGGLQGDLGGTLDAPAPPPAPALLAAVGDMQPVRTRGRFTAFAAVAVAGAVAPLGLLVVRPWRADLDALPTAWVLGAAAVWFAAFAASLFAALVPARGDVLPAAGRASRVGLAALAVLAVFALVGSVQAPGVSPRVPPGAWPMMVSCVRCIAVLLPIAAVLLLAGVVALRRVLPMGARRIGVALGAAGGALGGLALHLHCPMAETAHVVMGHVGGVALAALAGGLLLPALLERPPR
jgi:Negative regulator of sigma F